jgi:outer membrane receptor protein involved in Fe transport
MEFGVRADRQTFTAETEISPRVNLALALGPRRALRLGWGRFHQPQGPQELQVEDGVTGVFPAQRAEHLSVHFDHAFAGGVGLGLGAYSKEMTRLRPRYENIFNPMVIFPEIEPDRVRIAAARGRATGIEVILSLDRGRAFGWWAGYALARAEDKIDGLYVPRSRDQRHTLNLVVHRRFGDAWDVTLAGQYHSGWPTTSVRAEPAQNPDGSPAIRALMGPRNAERLPPFHRLDLQVRRRFRLGRGTLGAFLEITNLYGRENVCCADGFRYLMQPDGSVRVERQEGFWLRQAPVCGLAWEFGP